MISGLFIFIYIFYYALVIGAVVCNIIGKWKCFTKAGEAGWKSIIPVYNWIVYYKICGMSPYWVIVNIAYMVIALIGSVVYIAYTVFTAIEGEVEEFLLATLIYVIVVSLAAIGYLVVNIISSIKFAKAFGKNGGYAVGLIFIPEVFLMILGFGNAQYIGAKNQ